MGGNEVQWGGRGIGEMRGMGTSVEPVDFSVRWISMPYLTRGYISSKNAS